MGKVRRSSKKFQAISLADQILDDQSVRPSGRVKLREEKDVDDKFVDDKLSKRILEQARIQQEELEEECGSKSRKSVKKSKTAVLGSSDRHDSSSSSDEELASEDEQYFENIEINEEDEKALEKFMSKNPPACQTLADIIMEKIKEKETEMQTHMSENTGIHMKQLDEKVVEMYRSVQQILSKYRSGKLPKAFKIIPALRNWEQILYLTKPDKWTAAAMYQATRIFTSNLNTKMAQRFFNLVLLPRIRDDIAEYKRLNYHLYLAVSKSLYKPAAFFKGFLLPLCESGTCTLQEATILSSILVKNSIPMLHSAAAILKIAEMDYTGASSIFLRMLLEKKYALPYRVIDAIVYHFLRFLNDKRDLPVLWHQCFLTFVQRYKENVSDDQKGVLRDVLRVHVHHQITPEIHRELNHSKSREARAAECAMSMD